MIRRLINRSVDRAFDHPPFSCEAFPGCGGDARLFGLKSLRTPTGYEALGGGGEKKVSIRGWGLGRKKNLGGGSQKKSRGQWVTRGNQGCSGGAQGCR